MKRHTRDIVVRGRKFGYRVRADDCPWPGHFRIVIWSRHCQENQKLQIRMPNDLQPVTPSKVRQLVEWAIDFAWTSPAQSRGALVKVEWPGGWTFPPAVPAPA